MGPRLIAPEVAAETVWTPVALRCASDFSAEPLSPLPRRLKTSSWETYLQFAL